MAVASDSTPAPDERARYFTRRRAEAAIERLIALLDAIDGDADLEPDECTELSLQYEIRGGALVRAA